MNIYPFDQSPIWHVVFHPGPARWARKYRHVSLAGYADDTWLHLDLHRGGVSMATIYRYDEVQDYLSYLLAHYSVLKFGPSRGETASFMRPMTCVSFTKHVLGVKSCALRPDGLFTTLVRNYSAEVLNEAENSGRNG
jgi:hypothetical protein